MQTFGVKNKEHYCMIWYFLEWSIHKRTKTGRRTPFALAYHLERPLCRYVGHELFMWLDTMFALLVESFQNTLFIKHTAGKDKVSKNMRSTLIDP